MAVLSEYEPREVFRFFEEICAIPHGSGNTKMISDYLADFAKKRNLRYIQDKLNNVIIFKDGSPGYEDSEPVILQGHMDMVCEKADGVKKDMEKEGLDLECDGEYISAKGTTLGGDDGIAVAYALAILDSDTIAHPPVEAIFTVDEETGMYGADYLDCSVLRGKTMLNMDSEDEGYLLAGCAGGAMSKCIIPVRKHFKYGKVVDIALSGLIGGHSGIEIDKGRANANKLMGRILGEAAKKMQINLITVEGGLKDNAIPRSCTAKVLINPNHTNILQDVLSEIVPVINNEFRVTDPDIMVKVTGYGANDYVVMDDASTDRVIKALRTVPDGVQRMSYDIMGLVQTSLNLGILKTEAEEVTMSFAVRSSLTSEKAELIDRLEALMSIVGGRVETSGDYPAWEYRGESRLRDLMIETFVEQYGEKPIVHTIHAGVECGIFSEKIDDLDAISYGPDMLDIHTFSERLNIESVRRTWEYTLAVLEKLK